MRRAAPNQLAIGATLVILALLGASYWIELNDSARLERRKKAVPEAKATPTPEPPVETVDLIPALRNNLLSAGFSGNGREILSVAARNLSATALRTTLPPGLIFTTADAAAQVVCTRKTTLNLKTGADLTASIPCASIRLTNSLGDHVFFPAENRLPAIEPLWPALERFPDATSGTIQTAVLLLTEDPPLAQFAKFPLSAVEKPKVMPPVTFRVDTQDIVLALGILGKATPERYFKLIDSAQLRLEALIDSASHDAAIVFYNISQDQQFDFWRTELAHGDPTTRHYALYGIARYYPDIAYEMLPQWITEPRTPLIYRQHAAYALAEIPTPEALKALVQLKAQLANDRAIGPALDLALSRSQETQARSRSP